MFNLKLLSNMKTTISLITRFFIFSGFILFLGCNVKPVLYQSYVVNTDLSTFQKQGFLITTGDYNKDYDPISMLSVTCYNGYIKKENSKEKKSKNNIEQDGIYSQSSSVSGLKNYNYKMCDINDLLNSLFGSAKELNANGIINLKVLEVNRMTPDNSGLQRGILLTGLAINR